jgi:hypothetical protein
VDGTERRPRAIENSVYVAAVCQAPPVSVGRSRLAMGYVEADLGLEAGVGVVDVSLGTVARCGCSFLCSGSGG